MRHGHLRLSERELARQRFTAALEIQERLEATGVSKRRARLWTLPTIGELTRSNDHTNKNRCGGVKTRRPHRPRRGPTRMAV